MVNVCFKLFPEIIYDFIQFEPLPLTSFNDSFSDDPQVTGTPTFSPVASPHKGLPPRPPSHSRPPPPQSLDGLRHMHYTRSDYDKSPIKPKMWSESSLDEPYEKVKKRSSHSRYVQVSSDFFTKIHFHPNCTSKLKRRCLTVVILLIMKHYTPFHKKRQRTFNYKCNSV